MKSPAHPTAASAPRRFGNQLPLPRLAAAILAAVGMTASAADSLSVPQTSVPGFLAEADGPAAIPVSAAGHVDPKIGVTTSWKVVFALVDENNAVQNVMVGGVPQAGVEVTGNVGIAGGDIAPSAALDPQDFLSAASRYAIRATLFSPSGSATIRSQTQTPLRKWRHRVNHQDFSADFETLTAFTTQPLLTKSWALDTDTGGAGTGAAFTVQFACQASRFDHLAAAATQEDFQMVFTPRIRPAGTPADIPLSPQSGAAKTVTLASHGIAPVPYGSPPEAVTVPIFPAQQLASASGRYDIIVEMTLTDPNGAVSATDSVVIPNQQLLHFNGALEAGNLTTEFRQFTQVTGPTGAGPTGGILVTPTLGAAGGGFPAVPGWTFGAGASPLVELMDDGTARLQAGISLNISGASPVNCGGTPILWQNAVLTSAGAQATPQVLLPGGFSWNESAHAQNQTVLVPPRPASPTWRRKIDFPGIALDSSLCPIGGSQRVFSKINGGSPEPIWFSLDGLPVIFRATEITWDLATGRFTLTPDEVRPVRAESVQSLKDAAAANLLVDPLDERSFDKKSNDDYFLAAVGTAGPLLVSRDAQGRAVIESLSLNLTNNAYTTHYPAGLRVAWSGGGTLAWSAGEIVPTSSLQGAAPVAMNFLREEPLPPGASPQCASGASPGAVALRLDQTVTPSWRFTPDGGLAAEAPVTQPGTASPAPLQWGAQTPTTFAFETAPFPSAAVVIPGQSFQHEGTDIAPADAAAALLLTGFAGSAAERPGADAYSAGSGDYAGFNFRAAPGTTVAATARLAGNGPVSSQLSDRTKYNLRPSGLTGIHESVAFNEDVTLFGFDSHLDSLKLGFLDGVTTDSRTHGALTVPKPHDPATPKEFGFGLPFRNLRFTGRGGLDRADLGQVQPFDLPYWGVPVRPLAMTFAGQFDANGCVSTSAGALLLSVDAKLASLTPNVMRTTLGFLPNGDLASNVAGVPTDSGFQLPGSIKINGPSDDFDGVASFYTFAPSGRAYLNSYALRDRGDSTGGFISVPGTLHSDTLPGIRVQLHARSATGAGGKWNTRLANPQDTVNHSGIWIMGGWPMNVKSQNVDGWHDAGTGMHFFNNSKFDPDHRGFPGDSLASYRRPSGNAAGTAFMAKAHTSLLDVVKLESPLIWDNQSRCFRSPADQNIHLLVVDTKHRFVRLTPREAEIKFGITMAGDISSNLTRLLDDYQHEKQELFGWVDSGIRNAAMNAPVLKDLLDGIDSIDRRLSDKVDRFFDPILDNLVAGPVEQIIDALHGEATKVNQTVDGFRTSVENTLVGALNSVPDLNNAVLQLKDGVNGAVEGPQKLIEDVKMAVDDLIDAVGSAKTIMGTPPHPFDETHRHIIREIALAIGRNSKRADGIAYGVAALGDGVLEEYFPEAESTFRKIDSVLRDLDRTLRQIRSSLDAASDFVLRIQDTLTELLNEALNAGGFLKKFSSDLAALAKGTATPHLEFPSAAELRTAIKQKIKNLLRDRLYQTVFPSRLQSVLKEYLAQPRERLIGVLDLLFAKIEQMLRDAVTPPFLAEAEYKLNRISEAAGKLKEVVKAAGISGSATINGHSITQLRLDADLALSVPEDFKFRGWFEFNDYGRTAPAKGCFPAGVLGASIGMFAEADASFGKGGVHVSETGFIGMVHDNGPLAPGGFRPVSLHGDCLISGGIDAGGVTVQEARMNMALGYDPGNAGLYDAYLGARVKAKVGFITGDVALFMGRACNLEELKVFDPDTLDVLRELNGGAFAPGAAFNGVYLNWGGQVNLSEVFRIPRVLLDVSGKRYQGVFGFVREGPNPGITTGMRLVQSMKGEAVKTFSVELTGKGIGYFNLPTGTSSLWSDLQGSSVCFKASGKTEVCAWEFCEDFTVNLGAELRATGAFGVKLDLPLDIGSYAFPVGFEFSCP